MSFRAARITNSASSKAGATIMSIKSSFGVIVSGQITPATHKKQNHNA
jgi:hypothetical protein